MGLLGYGWLEDEKDSGIVACESVEELSLETVSGSGTDDISEADLRSMAEGFEASQYVELGEIGFLAIAWVDRVQIFRKDNKRMTELATLKMDQYVRALRSACIARGVDMR